MLDLRIAVDGDRCAGCKVDLTGSGTIAIRNDLCYCRKCIAAGRADERVSTTGMQGGARPTVPKK
jgi:late competence protein required for DNA uptake (superfamily II DNA/RNA helicase)